VLKPCELRLEREVAGEPGQRELVCGAGGFRLALSGGDTAFMERTCAACPIPDEVEGDRWRCLHLRPVKVDTRVAGSDGDWRHYFACRWFFRLKPHAQPESIGRCHGCPWWFPRPEVGQMARLGYWEETELIREAIRTALLQPVPPPPASTPRDNVRAPGRPPTLWERFRAVLGRP
jgi:hypothetical protein